jgi:hypothetical protein
MFLDLLAIFSNTVSDERKMQKSIRLLPPVKMKYWHNLRMNLKVMWRHIMAVWTMRPVTL